MRIEKSLVFIETDGLKTKDYGAVNSREEDFGTENWELIW